MYMLCIIYTVRRSLNLIGFVTLVPTLPLDHVRSGGCWRTLIPLSRGPWVVAAANCRSNDQFFATIVG